MLLAVAHYLSPMGVGGWLRHDKIYCPHWQWIGGQSSIVLPYTLLETTTDNPPFLKTMGPHPRTVKEEKDPPVVNKMFGL